MPLNNRKNRRSLKIKPSLLRRARAACRLFIKEAPLTIRELRREDYKGKIYTFSYVTHGFYSICAAPGGFSVKYTPLPAPVEKSFQDELFSPWLEAPRLYGAFEGNVLAGFVEGSPESWNHRFRITNLLVMEPFRGRGIGGALLEHMVAVAQAHGARMAVLEAQSCNPFLPPPRFFHDWL